MDRVGGEEISILGLGVYLHICYSLVVLRKIHCICYWEKTTGFSSYSYPAPAFCIARSKSKARISGSAHREMIKGEEKCDTLEIKGHF